MQHDQIVMLLLCIHWCSSEVFAHFFPVPLHHGIIYLFFVRVVAAEYLMEIIESIFLFFFAALNVEMQHICHEVKLPLTMLQANCIQEVLIANKTEKKQTFENCLKPKSRNLANGTSIRTMWI